MNRFFFVFIYLFLITLASAENIVKIGWIGPLTGNSAVLGIDSLNVLKDEVEKINNSGEFKNLKFQVIAEDDSYETKKTISAYHRLVYSEKVKIIIALTYSGVFAISPLAEKDQVLILDPLDCDKDLARLPSYTICIAKFTEGIAHSIVEDVVKKNLLPTGIIYFDADAFPVKLIDETKKTFHNRKIKNYFADSYNNQNIDFKSTLIKFKNKKIKSLIFYGYDPIGVAMHQARSLGIEAQFYSVATITSPGHMASAKGSDEGTRVAVWQAPKTEKYQKFLNSYEAKYKRKPFFDISTVPTYDIAYILKYLVSKQEVFDGIKLNFSNLKSELYKLKDFQGLSGNLTIDSDGATRSLEMGPILVFKNGQLVAN